MKSMNPLWTPAFPQPGEAKLLAIPLSAASEQIAAYEQVLNREELARANRFVHADVRRRFIVCRGRLRQVLADVLQMSASDVEFRYEKWGKPQLAKGRLTRLHFNVSHSGEWALLGLAGTAIGVDLEAQHSRINYRAIASQTLSPREQASWNALPASDRETATLQLWVCKEALLKAMGLGIAEGLQQISLPLPVPTHDTFAPDSIDSQLQLHLEEDGSCRLNHWIDSTAWRLRLLSVVPQYLSAVCTTADITTVSLSFDVQGFDDQGRA